MKFSKPDREPQPEALHLHVETFENRRQMLLMYLGNGIGCFLLLLFGVVSLRANYPLMAFVTLLQAVVCSVNLLVLKTTGNLQLASRTFTIGTLLLFCFLLAGGGIDQTGPLWAYPIAAATIFLQGARRGLWLTALMFSIALFIFFGPLTFTGQAMYTLDFKFRFLATFGTLTLFAALHEYARARNQSQLLRVSAQLDRLSHTDQLTALPNRRFMLNRLEAENSRYQRHQRCYSIVFADIDHFKLVNDRHGHQVGDEALQAVAQTLRSQLRQLDEVCRWGGEEFLLLLPETDLAQAVEVAEKLRASVANICLYSGDTRLPLTMSFGVHTVNGPGSIDSFIHSADEKLYLAKKNGRNRIVAHLPVQATAAKPAALNNENLALSVAL